MSLKKLSRVFWFLAIGLETGSGPFEKWMCCLIFHPMIHRARSCAIVHDRARWMINLLCSHLYVYETSHTSAATQDFVLTFSLDVWMSLKNLSLAFWFLAFANETPLDPFEMSV